MVSWAAEIAYVNAQAATTEHDEVCRRRIAQVVKVLPES